MSLSDFCHHTSVFQDKTKENWNEAMARQPAFPCQGSKTNEELVVCLKTASTQPAAALSAPPCHARELLGVPLCCRQFAACALAETTQRFWQFLSFLPRLMSVHRMCGLPPPALAFTSPDWEIGWASLFLHPPAAGPRKPVLTAKGWWDDCIRKLVCGQHPTNKYFKLRSWIILRIFKRTTSSRSTRTFIVSVENW